MDDRSPWDLGFNARQRGVALSENPFNNPIQGSPESAARWAAGWADLDRHLTSRDDALEAVGWFGPSRVD